jgi:hypothetical protein
MFVQTIRGTSTPKTRPATAASKPSSAGSTNNDRDPRTQLVDADDTFGSRGGHNTRSALIARRWSIAR